MAKTHKDVEYAVDGYDGNQKTFKRFDEAAIFAVQVALAHGRKVNLDVLVYSKAGARSVQGSEGVALYEEDPEASVFERLEIKVHSVGRVP